MIQRIFFLIPPNVQLLDIIGPIHIFYEAIEYGAPLKLHFISLTDEPNVISCAGLQFGQLQPFDDFQLGPKDVVFVPGIEFELFSDKAFMDSSQPFLQWLKEQMSNNAVICSVCTGAFLLAHGKLLDHKVCTTHWKYLEYLQEHFPRAKVVDNRLFVFEENLFSSAGVTSGIDLALYLLEIYFGPKLAADVAKEVVIYFRRGEADPQLSIFLQYRNHINNRIHQVQDLITQQLDHKWTIDQLAEKIHTSPRNLSRLFKKTTGITIGDYLSQIRIEKAQQLLAEGNKMAFVAQACGLKSTNQLRNLLEKRV